MDFQNSNNKALLWNLLAEHGLFNDIPNEKKNEVEQMFHKNINIVLSNNENKELIELNKIFMQNMIHEIENFKDNIKKKTIQEVYTAEKIKSNNLNEFNSKLQHIENDFNSAIKLKKPSDINFNDETDNKFNTNIDDDLALAIASRNLDMEKMITSQQSTQKEANEWINNEVKNKKKKNVTFNDNVKELTNLISKEEETTNNLNDNNITTLLNVIISNQNEILSFLRK